MKWFPDYNHGSEVVIMHFDAQVSKEDQHKRIESNQYSIASALVLFVSDSRQTARRDDSAKEV